MKSTKIYVCGLQLDEQYFNFNWVCCLWLDFLGYENNYISKVNDINFLGLNINNTVSWKTHIDKILLKLSSACFAMWAVKQMLKAIYYSHFHSIISYGVIFWGHIAPSTRVFRLQKRIIRIMMGSRSKNSCRKLFTSLEILPLLLSIFFPFSDLLEKIRNFSPQIMRLTIMVLDNTSTFTTLRLI